MTSVHEWDLRSTNAKNVHFTDSLAWFSLVAAASHGWTASWPEVYSSFCPRSSIFFALSLMVFTIKISDRCYLQTEASENWDLLYNVTDVGITICPPTLIPLLGKHNRVPDGSYHPIANPSITTLLSIIQHSVIYQLPYQYAIHHPQIRRPSSTNPSCIIHNPLSTNPLSITHVAI